MKNRRTYIWYIEPLDPNTNLALSKVLREENYFEELTDNTGQPRNVWECRYQLVESFRYAKDQRDFKFRVYIREGSGQLRRVPDFLLRDKKKSAKFSTSRGA